MSISDRPAQLVGMSAVEIAQGVARGDFLAEEVLAAHLEVIERVNPPINAIVFPTFEQARQDAKALDEARRRGEPLGALAGVPMTIKENFDLAGSPSTMGLRRLSTILATEDGPLVAKLRAAGAVIVGKTNVPQLMLLHETENPLYGRTNHPMAPLTRSPGGSSGGEAAIIAAKGVPLGLGSDLGGSIRQPAHSCGIAGFKPTGRRLSIAGSTRNLRGMEAISVQPGPMARSVGDLTLAMQVLLGSNDDEDRHHLPPVRWRDPNQVNISSLRIGFWNDDGFFRPSPAIRRAVDEAAEALQRVGATVEAFNPPNTDQATTLYFSLISADAGAGFRRVLANETPDRRILQLMKLTRVPRSLRPLISRVASARGNHWLAKMVSAIGQRSTDEYWTLVDERNQYSASFLQAMRKQNLDCLVFPPHALPAIRHNSLYLAPAASYCFLANLVDLPAGVVPWTTVRPGEESDRPTSRDRSVLSAIEVERESAGLPVGVQVAGLPWRDDLVLATMRALEQMRPDPAKN
ncbi:MAG: amidase [Planctomycetota bacterium]|nr:amidase [Planctomycetota bacterium]